SIHQDTTEVFHTMHGRTVYGGGGIIPDVFISIKDSTYVTPYLTKVINAGLFQQFALNYVSDHGTALAKVKTVDDLLKQLPSDDMLLNTFVDYCNSEAKIRKQWAYINQSSPLIVNILKAMIARDTLGPSAYYQIINKYDAGVERAIQEVTGDGSTPPIKQGFTPK
ncbi:MAG: peptidase S41, partial [Muribaculaceae bacterium]|nr:peptidase S41 [Muribaculaceae bacterium]